MRPEFESLPEYPRDTLPAMPSSKHHSTILHLLPNYEVGGEQQVLYALLEAMADRPYRHIVVGVFEGPQDFRPRLEAVSDHTFDINRNRAPITQPRAFWRDVRHIGRTLMEIAREEQVCLVHGRTHDNDLIAMLLGKRLGVPAVATHAGARLFPDNRMAPSLRRTARALMLRWIVRSLDAIIAVGPDVRDNLIRTAKAPPERIHLVINAVARAEKAGKGERVALRRRLGLPIDRAILVVVGRLIPAKGVDALVEALGLLDETPATLLVIGDGPERNRLEQMASRIPHERVRFLGIRDDVGDLLGAADIYLSASHSEGTSIALIEAMACALPCVVADAPGLRDLVSDGENGRIFALKDAKDCARVIAQALAAPEEAAEWAARAQQRVRREFSMQTFVDRHCELYRALIDGRRG